MLADAIARAAEDRPDVLLETSTLTGAQLVALGTRTAGVMGTEELRDAVVAAGTRAGEGMWPMPLPAELRRGLDSPDRRLRQLRRRAVRRHARRRALPGRVRPDGLPWVHIDIAGPSYNTGAAVGLQPQGRHRRPGAHPARDDRGPDRRLTPCVELCIGQRGSALRAQSRGGSFFWRALQSRMRWG